jgi:hypothetical protein
VSAADRDLSGGLIDADSARLPGVRTRS